MKVLIYGGRDFGHVRAANLSPEELERRSAEYRLGYDFLTSLFPERNVEVIQGGATGADALGADWAVCSEVALKTFRADWQRWGRAAGPMRNARMLEEGKPEMAVEFPGGRGTADMRLRLQKAGVPVVKFTEAK